MHKISNFSANSRVICRKYFVLRPICRIFAVVLKQLAKIINQKGYIYLWIK